MECDIGVRETKGLKVHRGKPGAGSWVFRDSQKKRRRDLGSRRRRGDCLGGRTHVQGAVSGLTVSVSMAWLSVCQHLSVT